MRNEICIISGIFPPENGGPAKFAFAFSNWLRNKDNGVSVITLTDDSSKLLNSNGIQIRKISRKCNLIARYLLTSFFIRKKSKLCEMIIDSIIRDEYGNVKCSK